MDVISFCVVRGLKSDAVNYSCPALPSEVMTPCFGCYCECVQTICCYIVVCFLKELSPCYPDERIRWAPVRSAIFSPLPPQSRCGSRDSFGEHTHRRFFILSNTRSDAEKTLPLWETTITVKSAVRHGLFLNNFTVRIGSFSSVR